MKTANTPYSWPEVMIALLLTIKRLERSPEPEVRWLLIGALHPDPVVKEYATKAVVGVVAAQIHGKLEEWIECAEAICAARRDPSLRAPGSSDGGVGAQAVAATDAS